MTAKTRILIVEDEGIIARDIQRQLQELGYDPVGIAASGSDAIALTGALRPDAVLMDIHLHGDMDGIEAAARIRRSWGTPIIFLTAYATAEMVERAKQVDPSGYLIKPFDEQLLRTTIEIALNKDRVERDLRRSERKARALLDSAHDAIVTTDAGGVVVAWSASAARLFGVQESEAIGQLVTAFVPERWHASVLALLADAAGGRTADVGRVYGIDARRIDGTELPIDLSMTTWESDGGRFVTGFFRDTSRRRRGETLVRLQAAALEAASCSIAILDRECRFEWANPAFTTLTGYELDEVRGHRPFDVLATMGPNRARYDEMWATVAGGRPWTSEVVERRKDGTEFVGELTVTPVHGTDGDVAHAIAVERDLTAQKLLQDQFMQAQKMEVVGRLAGGVAHDFNNLLTIINGTSELALSGLEDGDPVRADFKEIRAAGERAAQLTRQLLAFSRQQVISPVVVCVSEEVALASRMIRRLVDEDVALTLDAAPDDGLDNALIDRGQFEQMLMNLVVNARDAMPDGGSLAITVRNVDVEAGAVASRPNLPAGPYVLLSVTDSGTGIPADIVDRIFEPFFTTKGQGKGTGLGLSTVYGIVHQCGGDIVVSSTPGHGSTFDIYLPRVSRSEAPEEESLDLAGRGEIILLVEDEDELRSVATRMLRAAGYEVLGAPNGAAALDVLADPDLHIDLLLTDVVMPGMNGAELAQRVRAQRPDIRVLFASGFADTGRVSREILADTGHFLAKPFSVGDLTARVRRVLDEPPLKA